MYSTNQAQAVRLTHVEHHQIEALITVTGRLGHGLHFDADLVQQVLILAQEFGYGSEGEYARNGGHAQAA